MKKLLKFVNWLLSLFNKLKTNIDYKNGIDKVKSISQKTEVDETKNISDLQEGERFVCHYCHKSFTLLAKNIFPTSVRLLYKDSYVTGKGVLCPHCNQTCITG